MTKQIIVGISDQQIAKPPDTLITFALGSCVGICLYDFATKTGGLAHVLLPAAFDSDISGNPYKYADKAVEALILTMEKNGCRRARLTAKIAGGANMFVAQQMPSIGERNVAMVKRELDRLHIQITAEDVGGNYGRTVSFDPANGMITIRAVGRIVKSM